MALVTSRTRSGLVVAEEAGDEARLSRALKDIDRDLILVRDRDEKYRMWVWKVLVWAGDDRPAMHVLDWREGGTGRPFPLTSGIVDAVDGQRRDRPGGFDAMAESDLANDRLRELRRREFDGAVADIEDGFRAQLERGRKQVSLAPDTKLPAHQRNRHLPAGFREGLR
jgi:hypothetical protein